MHTTSKRDVRRALYLLTTSLAAATVVAAPAFAQDDSQPYTQSQSQDPPSRVGRLAVVQGTVSTHAQNETQWIPAVLNAPVSTGDALWTEPDALAELEVDASGLWLAGSTELDVTSLDDQALHVSEPQGETYIDLQRLQPGQTAILETPRATVTLHGNGIYEIAAGDTNSPTTVTVVQGDADVSGTGVSLQVGPNETAIITGSDTFQGQVGPLVRDDFLGSMQNRDRPVQAAPNTPEVVAEMTGGNDLSNYGSWQDDTTYGQVWYPQVDSDWAPYRDGRWSYVAPWGWTWVDAAPWGFAPFHYGRWVQIGPRWGWAPIYPGYAAAYRPVYAPALVSFFGVGGGIGVGVGVGFGVGIGLGFGPAFGIGANIGWVPLGPREAYYPPYGVSRGYLDRVNVTNIRNVTNIYNDVNTRRNITIDHYQNARFATVMPARAMAASRPVAGNFHRADAADLGRAHPLVDRAPIAPGARTLGLSHGVAERLHIADAEARHAPGPAVEARPADREQARPALRDGRGVNARPAPDGAAAREGAPGLREPGGRPALRAPGEGRPDIGAERNGLAPDRGQPSATREDGGRPALRGPGETPTGRGEDARAQDRGAAARNEPARTDSERAPPERRAPEQARPEREQAPREQARPEAARPETERRAPEREAPREAAPVEHREAEPRSEAPRMEAPREAPHVAAPRPEPRPQPRPPEPRPQAPRQDDKKPH